MTTRARAPARQRPLHIGGQRAGVVHTDRYGTEPERRYEVEHAAPAGVLHGHRVARPEVRREHSLDRVQGAGRHGDRPGGDPVGVQRGTGVRGELRHHRGLPGQTVALRIGCGSRGERRPEVRQQLRIGVAPGGGRGVPGGGQQREQHPGRDHIAALAAQDQHDEPGQRPGHGDQTAPAEAFAQQQARPDGDQDGPGAERHDGADGEAGDLDRREVRALGRRPPAQRQKDRARGPRSLTRKIRDAAAPAVPQATPATTRYSRLRPTGSADTTGKDI
ncbi:hypothetical protein SBADM41S_05955 [Streptomyces badius]